jgi:2-iminoacetate synthase ThiH
LAKHYLPFVPLPYRPENKAIPMQTPPTGFDALRTIAVSRIYRDNFDHITAYWVGLKWLATAPSTSSRMANRKLAKLGVSGWS